MQKQPSENQPLIKKALSKIHTLLYPHKRQGFFTEDPQIEVNGEIYKLASFNRRILSSGIDMIIISIFVMPIGNLIANFTMGDELSKFQMNPELMINDLDAITMIKLAWDSGLLTNLVTLQLFTLLLVGIYAIFMWMKKGATLGKIIFKCRVVDSITYEKISLKQGIIRFAMIPFSILPLLMGLFMIDWTEKRQALHDKVAKTIVIYKAKL